MKRFVDKDWLAALATALFVITTTVVVGASAPVFYVILFGTMAAYVVVESKPPWLLRSPFGRWFRSRR